MRVVKVVLRQPYADSSGEGGIVVLYLSKSDPLGIQGAAYMTNSLIILTIITIFLL